MLDGVYIAGVKSLNFGDSIKSIKNNPGWWNKSSSNEPFTFEDTITDISTSVIFPDVEEIHLPDDLQELIFSFPGYTSLKNIKIPNGVTKMRNAFIGCTSLESVILPNEIDYIGERLFDNCTSLKNIEISNSITRIEERAFFNCNSLERVEIPSSVTQIGKSAFCHCDSLQSVDLQENLRIIGEDAFYYCNLLEGIEIPNSVTVIERQAFCCDNIKYLKISKNVTEIGGRIISGGILDFPDGIAPELIDNADPENCANELPTWWGPDYVYIGNAKYELYQEGYGKYVQDYWRKME